MSKQASDHDQANLVRSEQSDHSVRIGGASMDFAPDSPDSIPKLHVPGLSPDATSLPPEALRGEVPTLTDSVMPEAAVPPALPASPALPEAKLASMPDEPHDSPELAAPVQVFTEAAVLDAQALPAEPAHEDAQAPSDHQVHALPDEATEQADEHDGEQASEEESLEENAQQSAQQSEQPGETEAHAELEAAQELGPEADTWVEQMQVRIEKLTEEIHMLNDRLDRFEKLPKV